MSLPSASQSCSPRTANSSFTNVDTHTFQAQTAKGKVRNGSRRFGSTAQIPAPSTPAFSQASAPIPPIMNDEKVSILADKDDQDSNNLHAQKMRVS